MGIGRKTDFNLDYNSKTAVKFWQEYGKTYMSDFQFHNPAYKAQEEALMQCLGNIGIGFESVFEFGCGFGRITELVLSHFGYRIKKYDAIDISEHQIENAKLYLHQNAHYGLIPDCPQLVKSDLQTWTKQSDLRYDLVLAVEVLMHVPTSHIEKTVESLYDMAGRFMVTVDWTPTEEQLSQHAKTTGIDPICFVHDYDKIYRAMLEWNSITTIPIPQAEQTIFVVRK